MKMKKEVARAVGVSIALFAYHVKTGRIPKPTGENPLDLRQRLYSDEQIAEIVRFYRAGKAVTK